MAEGLRKFAVVIIRKHRYTIEAATESEARQEAVERAYWAPESSYEISVSTIKELPQGDKDA